MNALTIIIKVAVGLLIVLALFGGVLDAASLLGMTVSRWLAAFFAVALLVVDRELKVLSLSWQLDQRRDLQRKIDDLAGYRNGVINGLYAGAPTRANFEEWKKGFRAWEDALVAYLGANFPYAVFEMFKDQGMIPSIEFEHVARDSRIRKKHRSHLRRIAKHLAVLEGLIRENTALTIPREPTVAEVFSQLTSRT